MHVLRTSLVALALLAPPAAAGEDVVEVKIGKSFSANFVLGFALPCKHDVVFQYSVEGLVAPVSDSGQTSSTKIKFKALAVGFTTITATFTGPGGNCVGSAMATADVLVLPDPKFTDKAWKSATKDATKDYAADLDDISDGFLFEVDDILSAFLEGELTSSEAAFELSLAAEDALDGAAVAAFLALQDLSAAGSGLLADGGISSVPDAFAAGGDTSRWDDAVADISDDYDDFVGDVCDEIEEDLEFIADKRETFKARAVFFASLPFATPRGPGLGGDAEDFDLGHLHVLGGIAWADAGTGRVRWFGLAHFASGDVALQLAGPAGYLTLQTVASLFLLANSPLGRWDLDESDLTLAGSYLLGARYDRDDHFVRKVAINLAAPE